MKCTAEVNVLRRHDPMPHLHFGFSRKNYSDFNPYSRSLKPACNSLTSCRSHLQKGRNTAKLLQKLGKVKS